MLSQVVYLGLLWLGLIVLLNPGVSIGNLTKRYLKPRWWLIINSMWIWVVIPHHLETALYYSTISVTSCTGSLLAESCRTAKALGPGGLATTLPISSGLLGSQPMSLVVRKGFCPGFDSGSVF